MTIDPVLVSSVAVEPRGDLRAALNLPSSPARDRAIWRTLTAAIPAAGQLLGRAGNDYVRALTARADVGADHTAYLRRYARWQSTETLLDLTRVLVNSPNTLAALARNVVSPVHGSDRAALVHAVQRRLLILGCDVDDLTSRRATYACVDALRRSLQ